MSKDKKMSRRSFLKAAALFGGVTAVVGLSTATKIYREYEEDTKHAMITPEKEHLRDQALRDFVARSTAPVTMIGVDHEDTEIGFYWWLASNGETLKGAGISKVFVELNTDFAALFQKAEKGEISPAGFVKDYLALYPDDREWRATASPAEVQRVERSKLILAQAIAALSKQGISVIPYDRRYEGKLNEKSRFLAQLADSAQKLEDASSARMGLVGLFKKATALLFNGTEDLTVSKGADARREIAAMLKEGVPEALSHKDMLASWVAKDQDNVNSIESKRTAGDKILVVAGDMHVRVATGLRAIFDQKEGRTQSLSYVADKHLGDMADYIGEVKEDPFFKTLMPDAFLSRRTGEFIRTQSEPVPQPVAPQSKGVRQTASKTVDPG